MEEVNDEKFRRGTRYEDEADAGDAVGDGEAAAVGWRK